MEGGGVIGGGRGVEDVRSMAVAVWPSSAAGAVEAGDCRPVVAAARGEGVAVRWDGSAGAEVAAAGTWPG